MASPINDNLRREHRVGASLQPFQFNDTYDEASLNSNMLWAVTHLWNTSLEAQRELVGIKRFDSNMKKFERNVEKNLELGLPYYSYTLDVPIVDARFMETRAVKRHNAGKYHNDPACNKSCNEVRVNSDCASTHHVDRRKYPRLYTLQDTYRYRDIFKYHIFAFIGNKIFTDIMFMIDTNRIILVIEPNITSGENTTVKLNEFKRWMKEEYSLTLIGMEYSSICSFDGNPTDLIINGRVLYSNMKKPIKHMKFNTNAWLFCYSANPYNMGEMTTTMATLERYNDETYFSIDESHVNKMLSMSKVYCEVYNINDLKAVSNIGINRTFQIPISKNVIPPENIMVWRNNPDTHEYEYLHNADIRLYYPNVYTLNSRVSAYTSPKMEYFKIDTDKFREKSEEYGEYIFESRYHAVAENLTRNNVKFTFYEDVYGKRTKYIDTTHTFTFSATAEATWLSPELTKVSVDPDLFGKMIKNIDGGYRFRYDGMAWINENDHDNNQDTPFQENVIRLSDYGIVIEEGEPENGTVIFIEYKSKWTMDDGAEIILALYGLLFTADAIFYNGDSFKTSYDGMKWVLDEEPVELSEWGIDVRESSLKQNTKIIVYDECDFDVGDNLSIMYLQSDVATTEFINPIADYMEYNISYANAIIANAVPGDLKKYIPYTEYLSVADKDFIKHNLGAKRLNEYTMRAKRLSEMLQDDSNRYEYIYSQLMDRTAYRDHANPKFVIDFSKVDYYTKFKPHNYPDDITAGELFEAEISSRQFMDNHDECTLGRLEEFTEPMYKFVISHDKPKNYRYSIWINGFAYSVDHIYRENFKTIIYLPCRLINSNSVIEIEMMKVTNIHRTLKPIKFRGVDNSIEVPHDFMDISPQNIQIAIRREVTTNRTSSEYDPKLYESLTEEGIGASYDFGTLYYYEVAPDYEMHWLLFGMRKYVEGLSTDNMKITEASATEFNYEDTLTNYKGKNLKTLFNKEFITGAAIDNPRMITRVIKLLHTTKDVVVDTDKFLEKVEFHSGIYCFKYNDLLGGSKPKYCVYRDNVMIADAITLDFYGVKYDGEVSVHYIDDGDTSIKETTSFFIRVINEGPNEILITAEDEVTASGFYPTERRRFYQYLPYGKYANPIWMTPIGKPSTSTPQEIVIGYVRDENGKIIDRITEHRSLHRLSGVTTYSVRPANNIFLVSVVASIFNEKIRYVEGDYTFIYDKPTKKWLLHDEPVILADYGITIESGDPSEVLGSTDNKYIDQLFDNDPITPEVIITKDTEVEKVVYVDNQSINELFDDDPNTPVVGDIPFDEIDDNTIYSITVSFRHDSYFGYRDAIIYNTDIYHRWEFDLDTVTTEAKVRIPEFFDDPSMERFRVYCNGLLYVNGTDVEIDFNLRNGKFIRGSKVDFIFRKPIRNKTLQFTDNRYIDELFDVDPLSPYVQYFEESYEEKQSYTDNRHIDELFDNDPLTPHIVAGEVDDITVAHILIEYLPYKHRNVYSKYHHMEKYVDCSSSNLTRPLSLKYYDIYVDGFKLSDRDVVFITATRFIIKTKNVNDSTIAIFERAHDEDLYANANKMKKSLADSLCDSDPKFVEYLINKYS